jgi:hypothetical protein
MLLVKQRHWVGLLQRTLPLLSLLEVSIYSTLDNAATFQLVVCSFLSSCTWRGP